MKNLQYLATEIYKVRNCLSPEIMKEAFIYKEKKITILGVAHI